MILKIQKQELRHFTKDKGTNNFYEGWALFGDVKEVHEMEERDIKNPDHDISGRLFELKCQDSNPRFLKHILVHYKDGSTENFYFDGSAYLMNDEGKTIQKL